MELIRNKPMLIIFLLFLQSDRNILSYFFVFLQKKLYFSKETIHRKPSLSISLKILNLMPDEL